MYIHQEDISRKKMRIWSIDQITLPRCLCNLYMYRTFYLDSLQYFFKASICNKKDALRAIYFMYD